MQERKKRRDCLERFQRNTPFSLSRPARGPAARARERATRGPDSCAAACGQLPAGNPACRRWEIAHDYTAAHCANTEHSSFLWGHGIAEPKFSTGLLSASGAAVSDEVLVDTALKLVAEQLVRSDLLESPAATRRYLALRFASLEHEVFCGLFLDNRHRLIACDDLFRGTIDGASVHPREVVKQALAHNAAAVILAHNHPSGVAEPSQADELITLRLKEALALVDIRVLDHLVVASGKVVSLAERGVL
jgi:DNA repair protein RadC